MTTMMTGKCTIDQFWAEVALIGWKENGNEDSSLVQKNLLRRWDDEFCESMRDIHGEFTTELAQAVEKTERATGESSECGDDGFGDLMSHMVGLGKDAYEAALADPMLVIKRGQKHKYEECFSYCLPYARPLKEKLTFDEAMAKVRAEVEERKANRWEDEEDDDENVGALEMQAFHAMLGERDKMDPRYYMAWAKADLPGLEALEASPFAGSLPDLPFVSGILRQAAAGDLQPLIEKAAEFQLAVCRLRLQRESVRKVVKEQLEKLIGPLNDHRHHSLDNLGGDVLDYLTDTGERPSYSEVARTAKKQVKTANRDAVEKMLMEGLLRATG